MALDSKLYFVLPLADADCLDDMVCFQRDLLDPVPGCLGEGQISYDYCIVSQYSTRAPSTPALPPAMRPTSPNVPLPGLQTVGDNLALPLGLCQGKYLQIPTTESGIPKSNLALFGRF